MNKENERLLTMLNEKKISEEDYKLLVAAVDKKSSHIGLLFSLMVNPFQKIAGVYALFSGLAIIFLMSFLGAFAKFYSVGIIGCLNAIVVKNLNIQPTFILILYQNVVVWLVVSFLYIIIAKIFQQKRLRIVDFFGTVALARFPFLVLMTLLVTIRLISPSILDIDITKGLELHPSMFMSLLSAALLVCFIWEIVAYFYALKESSGLTGKKLWISFPIAFILGEIITAPLTMIFF